MSDARPNIFTVVLTGGIASGKTAVSDVFAELGVPIIDTDRIAREVVRPGQPALDEIISAFGAEMRDSSGSLNRARLRTLIFSNPAARARLEAITHPRIAMEALRQMRASAAPYCLLVVPLYTESARWPWIDRVLVVDVDEPTQIERVMARDGIDREQAESILRTQAGRAERLALADDVIDNSGRIEALKDRVAELHARYLDLAAAHHRTPGNNPDDLAG